MHGFWQRARSQNDHTPQTLLQLQEALSLHGCKQVVL